VSSFTSQNVGVYCPSGVDRLAPYLKRDSINTTSSSTTRYYTQYGGKRCALPLLADSYGFYNNKQLFTGGLTRRRGRSRAHRLRGSYDAEGRRVARRRRLRPVHRLLPEPIGATARRSEVLDASGKSSLSTPGLADPPLAEELVDYYGHDKLVSGRRAPVTSIRASRLRRGKLAMMIDGGWRVAFCGRPQGPLLRRRDAGRQVHDVRGRLHQRHDHRHPGGGKNTDCVNLIVPDDEHARAGDVLQRIRNAVHGCGGEVEGAC
jgi:multiple sugar transport system substrate-binding protein